MRIAYINFVILIRLAVSCGMSIGTYITHDIMSITLCV